MRDDDDVMICIWYMLS